MRSQQYRLAVRPLIGLALPAVACMAMASIAFGQIKSPPTPPPFMPDIKTPATNVIPEATDPNRPTSTSQRVAAVKTTVKPVVKGGETSADISAMAFTEPVFDFVDGSVWVRGATYKAQFNAQGVTYIPYLGSSAPRNYPVQFNVASISVGGQALQIEAVNPVRTGSQVVFDRGSVQEIYHIGLNSIEQTFVLNQKPSIQGDITVLVDVTTDMASDVTNGGFKFSNERGHVTYTNAVLVDAGQARTDLATQLTNGRIEIRVPAPLVEAAAYPIVIDPVISSFTVFQGTSTRWSDVAYDAVSDSYIVVWEFDFSAADGDIYSRRFTDQGVAIDASNVAIDVTGFDWRKPKVAYNRLAQNYLVVAQRGVAPSRAIWGRTRVANSEVVSDQFQIGPDPVSGDQSNADVGGDPATAGPTYYFVVWERRANAADHGIHGQMVNSDATNFGNVILIDNSSALDINPAISKSNGQSPFPTQVWTIVWERVFAAADHHIFGAQYRWNGDLINATYPIDISGSDNRYPRVSTILDEDIAGGARRYLVVYEENPDTLGDIWARVYRGPTLLTGGNLTVFENVQNDAARRRPVVESTNGDRFVVATEQQFSGPDWDTYISQYCLDGNTLRVAEQHRTLDFSADTDSQLNVAGVYKASGAGGSANEFVAVWTNSVGDLGSIRAARYNTKNSCCIADVNGDGQINANDLLTVINQWTSSCLVCEGDVNGDQAVNANDLLAVINAWGPCP